MQETGHLNPFTATLVPVRRIDIDWLRIFAAYAIVIYHTARPFETGLYSSIQSAALSWNASAITFFVSQWYIPLVFFISGWSRKNSMQQLTPAQSVRERFMRLIVPFLTGCVLSWTALWYLSGPADPGRSAASGLWATGEVSHFLTEAFTAPALAAWFHLLLLPCLFIFSLVCWPLFSWLLSKKVTPLKTDRIWVYLPVLPLGFIHLVVGGYQTGTGTGLTNQAMLAYFIAYFVLGFVISRYSAYERAIHQEARVAGIIGILLFFIPALFRQNLAWQFTLFTNAAASWCFLLGVLGFAKRFFEAPTTWFSYLRESSLPVFILHQVPVLFLVPFIIRIDSGLSVKYLVLLTASLGSTLMIYHFLIRRFALLRLLFGMKTEEDILEVVKDQAVHHDRS